MRGVPTLVNREVSSTTKIGDKKKRFNSVVAST